MKRKTILIKNGFIYYNFTEDGRPTKWVDIEKFTDGVLITMLLLSTIFLVGVMWYTKGVSPMYEEIITGLK